MMSLAAHNVAVGGGECLFSKNKLKQYFRFLPATSTAYVTNLFIYSNNGPTQSSAPSVLLRRKPVK